MKILQSIKMKLNSMRSKMMEFVTKVMNGLDRGFAVTKEKVISPIMNGMKRVTLFLLRRPMQIAALGLAFPVGEAIGAASIALLGGSFWAVVATMLIAFVTGALMGTVALFLDRIVGEWFAQAVLTMIGVVIGTVDAIVSVLVVVLLTILHLPMAFLRAIIMPAIENSAAVLEDNPEEAPVVEVNLEMGNDDLVVATQ